MLAVVKLIIVNCKFDLPEENHADFVKSKMVEFHYQTLVCAINLT